MIPLETVVELKFLNSSFSSLSSYFKLDKQFPVERFEAASSQSTVPQYPPLLSALLCRFWRGSPEGTAPTCLNGTCLKRPHSFLRCL